MPVAVVRVVVEHPAIIGARHRTLSIAADRLSAGSLADKRRIPLSPSEINSVFMPIGDASHAEAITAQAVGEPIGNDGGRITFEMCGG